MCKELLDLLGIQPLAVIPDGVTVQHLRPLQLPKLHLQVK